MAKRGRPTDYTPETAQYILKSLKDGRTLTEICEEPDMPNRVTVYDWTERHPDFNNAYIRARQVQQHTFVDMMLRRSKDESRDYNDKVTEHIGKDGEIYKIETERKSDNTAVQRDKLICETLWRVAQVINAKDYGAREKLELSGPNEGPIQYEKTVDRPPTETHEQWKARVQKQLQQDRGPLN